MVHEGREGQQDGDTAEARALGDALEAAQQGADPLGLPEVARQEVLGREADEAAQGEALEAVVVAGEAFDGARGDERGGVVGELLRGARRSIGGRRRGPRRARRGGTTRARRGCGRGWRRGRGWAWRGGDQLKREAGEVGGEVGLVCGDPREAHQEREAGAVGVVGGLAGQPLEEGDLPGPGQALDQEARAEGGEALWGDGLWGVVAGAVLLFFVVAALEL